MTGGRGRGKLRIPTLEIPNSKLAGQSFHRSWLFGDLALSLTGLMNEAKKYCLEEVDPVPALVIVKLNNEVTWCTRAGERYRHYCYICNISIQYSVPSCPFPPRS